MSIAIKYARRPDEFEPARDEATAALCRAVATYRIDGDASIESYATSCVQNAVWQVLGQVQRRRGVVTCYANPATTYRLDAGLRQVETRDTVARILEIASPTQRRHMMERLRGDPVTGRHAASLTAFRNTRVERRSYPESLVTTREGG